ATAKITRNPSSGFSGGGSGGGYSQGGGQGGGYSQGGGQSQGPAGGWQNSGPQAPAADPWANAQSDEPPF
ncbi:MAG: single-stranded DNA-binding protein, partial [Propionibacteriaceae bacterium]|nr:single-stranded DNA-binding protein [Propionibacteriaceae bacterium]